MRSMEVRRFIPVENAFPDAAAHKAQLEANGVKVAEKYFIDLPLSRRRTYHKSIENFERSVGHMIEPTPKLPEGATKEELKALSNTRTLDPNATVNLTFFKYHGGVYNLEEMGGSEATESKPEGVSKQAVQSRMEREFVSLHARVPKETRYNFPMWSLDVKRRERLDTFLHSATDSVRKIMGQLQDAENPSSYRFLRREFPGVDLNYLRESLRGIGLSNLVPHADMKYGLSYKNWVDLQRVDAQDFEVQEALDSFIKHFPSHKAAHFPVVFMSDLIREVGIHLGKSSDISGGTDYDKIADALKRNGIPHRMFASTTEEGKHKGPTQRYLVSAINQRDRVLEVLQNDFELSSLRLSKVCSVGASYTGEMPNTGQLVTDGYISLGRILTEIHATGVNHHYSELLSGFPYHVFRAINSNNYYVPVSEAAEIRDYLLGHLVLSSGGVKKKEQRKESKSQTCLPAGRETKSQRRKNLLSINKLSN